MMQVMQVNHGSLPFFMNYSLVTESDGKLFIGDQLQNYSLVTESAVKLFIGD